VTDAVNPAANSQVIQNATMNWGLKKSFRDYLAKPAVGSRIETTNGLARNADGTFKWSAGTGTYQNGSGTINFPGTLHITGHHGKLDMTFTNVRLQLNGREGKLILDGSSLDMQGNNHVFKDTEFATVDTSSVRVNGSTLTLNNAAVTLTPAGAQAFSGFYNKAEEYRFDPLTVNAGLRGTHAVFSDVPEGAAFYTEIQWFAQQFAEFFRVDLQANYTYQRATDVTSPEAKNYRDQIPYTPLHSGSGSAALRTPWIDAAYTVVAVGDRYYMSQNLPENRVNGYAEHTIALSRTFHIHHPDGCRIRVQAECVNWMDAQYDIIKYYPMPGRSLRATVAVTL